MQNKARSSMPDSDGDQSFVRNRPALIGLTGKRGVGKSTVAGMLCEMGFLRVHSFDGGKVATAAYFRHLGIDPDTAARMTYGDLRDAPCDLLPGQSAPRYFMERLGKFMGSDLGAEWTLGVELDRTDRRDPSPSVVVESVVYESEIIRARGGVIYRVERNVDGPAGVETDRAQAEIQVDGTIGNDGTLADLRKAVAAMAGAHHA